MSGQSTPAGWYPDPENASQERYWDGAAWGDSRALVGAAPGYNPAGYGFGAGSPGGVPANFGQRLGAYLIDVLIVGVSVAVLSAIFGAISDVLGLIVYLAGIVGGVYYFAHFEGGPTGQTIGKKTLNIRVVDATTGQPGIGMGRAVGRYFARIVSALPCYLGFLWMLWDEKKETWHDKMLTTRVTQG